MESVATAEAVTPAAWFIAAPVRAMRTFEAVRLPAWLLRPAAAPPTLSPVTAMRARRTDVVAPGNESTPWLPVRTALSTTVVDPALTRTAVPAGVSTSMSRSVAPSAVEMPLARGFALVTWTCSTRSPTAAIAAP